MIRLKSELFGKMEKQVMKLYYLNSEVFNRKHVQLHSYMTVTIHVVYCIVLYCMGDHCCPIKTKTINYIRTTELQGNLVKILNCSSLEFFNKPRNLSLGLIVQITPGYISLPKTHRYQSGVNSRT